MIFHYNEILQASNTGKLLKLLDDNTEILIFGIEEYEKRIRDIFADENFVKISVCLFPSKDSVLASDYYKKLNEEKLQKNITKNKEDNDKINNSNQDEEKINLNSLEKSFEKIKIKGLNVFVIDGTWPQAISMMQIVPKNMVKVKIVAAAKNIYNSLRYRYSEDTCSTIEAVATLLDDLGETEENIKEIYNSLVLLVDINLQRKKTPEEEAELQRSKIDKFEGFTDKDFDA